MDQDAYDNIAKELEIQEEMYERVDRIKALRNQKTKEKEQETKPKELQEESSDESDYEEEEEDDDDLLWRKQSI